MFICETPGVSHEHYLTPPSGQYPEPWGTSATDLGYSSSDRQISLADGLWPEEMARVGSLPKVLVPIPIHCAWGPGFRYGGVALSARSFATYLYRLSLFPDELTGGNSCRKAY